MFKNSKLSFICLFISVLLILSPALSGIQAKRALSHNDYDSWKSIVGAEISSNGHWVLYLETPQDGEADLVVKNLKTDKEYRHTIGYSGEGTDSEKSAKPKFSYDTTHIIFIISPSKVESKKFKKNKKKKDSEKPNNKLGIMDLSNGKVTLVENVKSFKLPKKVGGWVVYLKESPPKLEKKEEKNKEEEEKKEKEKKYGTPLVLRSLKDSSETLFESVLDYLFTKNGKFLIFTVSSKKEPETDGVYCKIPGSGSKLSLLSGKGKYNGLTMNKEETCMAFYTDRDDQQAEAPSFNLYGWKAGEEKAVLWISHSSTPGFPEGMAVSDKSEINFSDDGHVVMFGIKEISQLKKKDEEEKAKFDLWHWNDPYPQPQQKKIAKRIRNNTWESVYYTESKNFIKLADEEIPDVSLSRTGKIAFAQNIWPYTKRVSYDGSYYDIYAINPETSERTLVKKELYGGARLSPNGKYIYWFHDKDWYVYDINTKTTANLTASLDVPFKQYDWDRPNPPGSYGTAGWTDGDASLLIYDRYDIWKILPDASNARMITEGFGRKNNLSFRYVKLDSEEITINPSKPILLRVTNEKTMAQGFFQDLIKGKKPPKKLITADRAFIQVKKAEEADIMIFSRSNFDEYPDLWASDIDFANQHKITNLGRQMEPFIWGKAELRDFFSSDGKPLKGILIKPDNFDSNKKYPLIVYIYETLHQRFHSFRHPSPGSSVNFPYYVSNGYVMWMPDIEYDTGYPGKDALKCVLPGIQMLVREGFIDPESIGIQGHSWGGYQIAYMITQTNIFAAAEAGAPVSNMISAYGGIRWGSGLVRQFQYERTQSRIGGSPWEVPMRYIENSPIFWADKVQTPVMMMHNDEDGAVPWYQGIEYIMALRRLGKEAYMFNYNGEAHGLRKRVNQKDWTCRMAEFFNHHLKRAPSPAWMTNGIKAWEKEEEKEKEKTGI